MPTPNFLAEEIPYFFQGDIVQHKTDKAEYWVERQMPKNLSVIRLSDGAKMKGDARGFIKVREATDDDRNKVNGFKPAVDLSIDLGAAVTYKSSKKSIGGIDTGGLFVVLKVTNGETANITTMGGRADRKYLRVPLSSLTKVNVKIAE